MLTSATCPPPQTTTSGPHTLSCLSAGFHLHLCCPCIEVRFIFVISIYKYILDRAEVGGVNVQRLAPTFFWLLFSYSFYYSSSLSAPWWALSPSHHTITSSLFAVLSGTLLLFLTSCRSPSFPSLSLTPILTLSLTVINYPPGWAIHLTTPHTLAHTLFFPSLPTFFTRSERSSPSASLQPRLVELTGDSQLVEFCLRGLYTGKLWTKEHFFDLLSRSHTRMRLFLVWYWWKRVETKFAESATLSFIRKMLTYLLTKHILLYLCAKLH